MNIQEHIIKGIREQLYLKDYVVLPGFGGFVLQGIPARFSANGTHLLPPAKIISFNLQLRQNDGAMAAWLSEDIGCTVPQAIGHLTDFQEYCQSVLQARRRLSINGIGFFFIDFEQNVCFEPQHDTNFLSSSFGLIGVRLPATSRNQEPDKKETTFIDRTLATGTHKPYVKTRKKVYRRLAFGLAIGSLVLSLFTLFFETRVTGLSFNASLFDPGAKRTYWPIEYPKLDMGMGAKKAKIAPNPNEFNKANVEPAGKEEVVNSAAAGAGATAKTDKHYELVLGCFNVYENAGRLVSRLQALEVKASISGRNAKGMFIVSNGSFDSKSLAHDRLEQLRRNFPDAWIRVTP